jgi:hypothetical protein
MTKITITDISENGGDAVTHIFEDWQQDEATETVSQYVGRVRRMFDRAVSELSLMEGFGRDNRTDHTMTVSCPELDAEEKAIGTKRTTHAPRIYDPTSFRRLAVQGLNNGAAWTCGQLEKFLNGEQVDV